MRRLPLPGDRKERVRACLVMATVIILSLYCVVELYQGITGFRTPDLSKCMDILKQLSDGYKK